MRVRGIRRSSAFAAFTILASVTARAQEADSKGAACRFPMPLPSVVGAEAFERELYDFLDARCYEELGWTRDASVRDTGPWIQGDSYGTHPAVRIYYSPEVADWLRNGRQGAIADGGLIVKEMYEPPASAQHALSGWTFMARDSKGSFDGWFWGYHGVPADGEDASADEGGDDARHADTGYPDSGFGLYCLNCHASADNSQSTFSSLRNVDGDPLSFLVVDPTMHPPRGATEGLHMLKASMALQPTIERHLGRPDPAFHALFPQLGPVPLRSVVPFPGETLDDVLSNPGGPPQFLTSDQCLACHDATQSNAAPPNMIYPAAGGDGKIVNLSPYGEWRASMMGLAGRDPIFYAQLESELALHPTRAREAQELCFHCHGVMGQRQLALDTQGARSFTQDLVFAVPPQPDAKYGALARDGVSCTVCHHVSEQGLGTPASFTGDFVPGPPDALYGPFEKVATLPMKQALGIEPQHGAQVRSSALCGSCHAIQLPVFDAQGNEVKQTFEQTTYLEWLNSDFQNEHEPFGRTPQTCQDCHMPQSFQGQRLRYRIANVEDGTFPDVDHRAPAADLFLEPRDPYSRHTLYGINLFGLEIFQQFAPILGIRTVDPMATYGDDVPGLETAERAGNDLATTATASLAIRDAKLSDAGLECVVEVTNLAGHHLPSGVGFRRAFLRFEVLDAKGATLWVSGRTSPLGVLLGPDGKPLPSEFFDEVDGKQSYQPHYELVEREDEVQIYEELTKDCEGRFTTSFLSLCEHVKDNRIQPRGWTRTGPYAVDTRPYGAAELDCDYRYQDRCASPSNGTDSITYRVPAARAAGAASVRATLCYQAIPPYYLAQRFTDAKGDDTQRLYAFASHLKLEGTPVEGWKLELASASATVAR